MHIATDLRILFAYIGNRKANDAMALLAAGRKLVSTRETCHPKFGKMCAFQMENVLPTTVRKHFKL